MAKSHLRSKRKITGGRYIAARKKKLRELGREATMTKLGIRKVKTMRVLGGNTEQVTLSCDVCNLFNPKTKKYSKAKIITVLENSANRHFVRRNIVTKGTVVETDKGKAKILSRPGQEGSLNAILV